MMRLIALGAALVACNPPQQGSEPLPATDAAGFEAGVQPVITETCGSLDCHGDPGRPLRLYAERGLRLSAALRNTDITAEEIELNAAAFIGVSPGAVDDHLGLLKPLATSAGGMEHLGGDLWSSTDHADYAAIRDWLSGL